MCSPTDFLVAEFPLDPLSYLDHERTERARLMKRIRALKTIRIISNTSLSLVRTRTKRKSNVKKSRRRDSPKKLAEKLLMVRETLGYSQNEMARALGIKDRASISGYERGEREPPLPVLLAYARAAAIVVDVLIDDKLEYPSDKTYPAE